MKRVLFGLGLLLLAGAGVLVLSTVGGSHSALVVSPERLAFGDIQTGESARQAVVVTNTSDQPLAIAQRIEAGAPFAVSRDSFSLAPGQAQVVLVTFAPGESGRSEGQLLLESAAFDDGIRTVWLEGSAYRPAEIRVDPLFLSFGEVQVGEAAKVPVTIANRGEADLKLESLAVVRPFRAEVEVATVASEATRSVEVYFEPRAAGDYETSLLIRSNDTERVTVPVYLQGTGVDRAPAPRIQVQPSNLDFGAVPVGGSHTQSISIRNTGSDPLTLVALRAPAHFSAPARSREIEPGAGLSLPVSFSPGREGGLRGTLSIHSNDPDQQVIALSLSGAGQGRAVADSRGAGDALVGTSVALQSGTDGMAESRGAGDALAGTSVALESGTDGDLATGAPQEDELGRLTTAAEETAEETDGTATPAGPDPDVAEQEPSSSGLEGGKVRLASYSQPLSPVHADSISYDAASGAFAINGLRIPTVDAALGEYFQFDATAAIGRFDSLGEAEVAVPVRMYDTFGNPVDMTLELTTGVSTAVVGQTLVSMVGSPLGADGRTTLVGLARFPRRSPFDGNVMRLSLDVQFK